MLSIFGECDQREPLQLTFTGRTVHIEKKELPDHVRRMRPDGWSLDPYDGMFIAAHLFHAYFEVDLKRPLLEIRCEHRFECALFITPQSLS